MKNKKGVPEISDTQVTTKTQDKDNQFSDTVAQECKKKLNEYWLNNGRTHYDNGEPIIPDAKPVNYQEIVCTEVEEQKERISEEENILRAIIKDAKRCEQEAKGQQTNKEVLKDIFLIKTANQTIMDAANMPMPRKLWYELWFEGELCFMYAGYGAGKSIYAVQIADEISKIEKVILFDFELSQKQFQIRYSDDNGANSYEFNQNFLRGEINPDGDFSDDIEKQINLEMEVQIKNTGTKVIIVDNLTFLTVETEKSKSALPLMKNLKKLKNKYGLSILCLAHTPKREESRPITGNDLAGSKTLMNICDSAFAIGMSSRDKNMRYVKQIKVRNCEKKYDSENVLIYEILKENENFVKFRFIDYGNEYDHLKEPKKSEEESLLEKMKELKDAGKSYRQIADELGISKSKVERKLNQNKK